MGFIQKVIDFLNPVRIEEIQDKVGTVLFGVVGILTTILSALKAVGLLD